MTTAPPVAAVRHPLADLALLFVRLGLTSFGGPAAHVALIERECVRRRGWLTHQEFLDLMGIASLIPGPTSTELAMHVGYRRAGWPGLVLAGLAFILPAALSVGVLAAVYVEAGELQVVQGVLQAVQPVVLIVVLDAMLPLARTALTTPYTIVIGVLAVVAAALGVPALAVLILAGLVHLAVVRPVAVTMALMFMATRVMHAAETVMPVSASAVFGYFVGIGSLLFGSGYVLLPVLERDLVHGYGWLTSAQLIDAVAAGQATPGPVFTTATFIGYLIGGVPFAVVATFGMFLPAFFFSALSARFVGRLRASGQARRFLAGVNAAAVALVGLVLVSLGREVLVGAIPIGLCLAAAVFVLVLRISPMLILAGAAGGGALTVALG
jgi:chromate transporter